MQISVGQLLADIGTETELQLKDKVVFTLATSDDPDSDVEVQLYGNGAITAEKYPTGGHRLFLSLVLPSGYKLVKE